ncbi:MAG: hypothetical protein POH28_06050 [Acidocella sp.]|nr:hypothetical protein [Acidocella sp.]
MTAPIDISQALEAELAAAIAPAGLGAQPAMPEPKPMVAPEPRAIPIIPDAPPRVAVMKAPNEGEAPIATEGAPRVPKPRGRPRVAKPAVDEAKTGSSPTSDQ